MCAGVAEVVIAKYIYDEVDGDGRDKAAAALVAAAGARAQNSLATPSRRRMIVVGVARDHGRGCVASRS
jgi:hypothetical protein